MKNVRRINISISEEVFVRYQISVPMGSAICASCRTTHYKATNVIYQDAASEKHEETIPEEMPSLSGAQLDAVHCEASSTMIGETQSLSSQSSQGTDNI